MNKVKYRLPYQAAIFIVDEEQFNLFTVRSKVVLPALALVSNKCF
jgi:hypothetical protein